MPVLRRQDELFANRDVFFRETFDIVQHVVQISKAEFDLRMCSRKPRRNSPRSTSMLTRSVSRQLY